MKFLDRLALNRLISIQTSFILNVLKLVAPKESNPISVPKPKRPKVIPWRNKDE